MPPKTQRPGRQASQLLQDQQPKKSSPGKRLGIGAFVAVLLGVLSGAGYWVYSNGLPSQITSMFDGKSAGKGAGATAPDPVKAPSPKPADSPTPSEPPKDARLAECQVKIQVLEEMLDKATGKAAGARTPEPSKPPLHDPANPQSSSAQSQLIECQIKAQGLEDLLSKAGQAAPPPPKPVAKPTPKPTPKPGPVADAPKPPEPRPDNPLPGPVTPPGPVPPKVPDIVHPQEACARGNFFSREICLTRECRKPENAKLPFCVKRQEQQSAVPNNSSSTP